MDNIDLIIQEALSEIKTKGTMAEVTESLGVLQEYYDGIATREEVGMRLISQITHLNRVIELRLEIALREEAIREETALHNISEKYRKFAEEREAREARLVEDFIKKGLAHGWLDPESVAEFRKQFGLPEPETPYPYMIDCPIPLSLPPKKPRKWYDLIGKLNDWLPI